MLDPRRIPAAERHPQKSNRHAANAGKEKHLTTVYPSLVFLPCVQSPSNKAVYGRRVSLFDRHVGNGIAGRPHRSPQLEDGAPLEAQDIIARQQPSETAP